MPVYGDGPKKMWTEVHLGGKVWNVYRKGESLYSSPAIAAHVTGYGRRYLWYAMREVPAKHLYRVHTDSLLVDAVGLSYLAPLLNEKEPGFLKVENAGSYMKIVDVGLYTLGSKVKRSGLTDHAKPLPEGGYRDKRVDHLAGMLRRGKITPYTERKVDIKGRGGVSPAPPPPGRWLPVPLVQPGSSVQYVPRERRL